MFQIPVPRVFFVFFLPFLLSICFPLLGMSHKFVQTYAQICRMGRKMESDPE